jgi:divalent metal cation (Fe/Co/Zn/Cd) transporter
MNEDRASVARMGSIIGVAGNALLAVIKVFTGFFTGSMAILADGVDSNTDILTSIITWISTSVSSKPPMLNTLMVMKEPTPLHPKLCP